MSKSTTNEDHHPAWLQQLMGKIARLQQQFSQELLMLELPGPRGEVPVLNE